METPDSKALTIARGALLLAGLLALLATPTASAQTRPLLTEEATTAPAGTVVLEAGVDQSHAEPNFLTGRVRDRWDLPVLRLVYSPAGNVEIDLEWVGRVVARNDPDFGSVSDWGDVTLRAKIRLNDVGPSGRAWGARFAVSLPETSASHGLGPNVLRMFADLLLTQPLGRASLHLNAGLFIHEDVLLPGENVRMLGQEDFLSYGVGLVVPLGKRISLIAEAAGRAGSGSPGADQRGEVRTGIRLGSKALSWDAAVRHGITPVDGTWGFTTGMAWTLKPGK